MRCPHCGKNNYGDVTKCYSCGQDMKTTTGQAVVARPPPQKAKAVKRIKMPVLIIIGIVIVIFGIIVTILPYFLFTATASDMERDDNGYFSKYEVGETVELRGEITYKLKCPMGYIYEIDGDAKFKAADGTDLTGDKQPGTYQENAMNDKDATLWSWENIGNEGDSVFIEVVVMTDNDQIYQWLEKNNNEPWAWKYFIWGIPLFLIGAVLALIGFIGKKDTSMEEYMAHHPELKKGDISLSEYQKRQAEEERRKVLEQKNVNYGAPPPPGQPPAAPPPAPAGAPEKPSSGICGGCNQQTLVFNDDGTGDCSNCHRHFVWDPSRAPQQQAPAQPLAFEAPK